VSTATERALPWRAQWARLALCREVIARSWWARLGWLAVALPLALLASESSPSGSVHAADALMASIGGAIQGVALLGGGAVAVAATSARLSRGETSGLAWLLASRGASPANLVVAEFAAAVLEIALRFSMFALGVSLWVMGETRRLASAKVFVPCLAFGAFAALLFGGLAVAAGAVSRRRAGLVVVAAIAVPSAVGVWWAIPSLLGRVWTALAFVGGAP